MLLELGPARSDEQLQRLVNIHGHIRIQCLHTLAIALVLWSLEESQKFIQGHIRLPGLQALSLVCVGPGRINEVHHSLHDWNTLAFSHFLPEICQLIQICMGIVAQYRYHLYSMISP